MFQTQIVGWMISRGGPAQDRDRAHRIALSEARIADSVRSTRRAAPVAVRVGSVSSGVATATVACCAA